MEIWVSIKKHLVKKKNKNLAQNQNFFQKCFGEKLQMKIFVKYDPKILGKIF